MRGERVSIIFMRDSGTSRRFRVSRRGMGWGLLFLALMPPLLLVSLWHNYKTWDDVGDLTAENQALQERLTLVEAAASRVAGLQVLVQEPRESVERHLSVAANAPRRDAPEGASAASPTTPPMAVEGPGHEDFPATESGIVTLRNVMVRELNDQRVRISMDVCNLEGKGNISGRVVCQLLTENGAMVELGITPESAAVFRITRLKKAVFSCLVPRQHSIANGRMIISVSNDAGELLYRNIYAVSR